MTSVTLPFGVERALLPRIERTDIRFKNLDFELVQIEVELRNDGDALCPATPVRIEAAPFGAFLPWQPLATRTAPPIAPGGTAKIVLEARRPRVQPIASFADLPPRDLPLIAAAAGDAEKKSSLDATDVSTTRKLSKLFRDNPGMSAEEMRSILCIRMANQAGLLPADLFDLLGRNNPHWVGNLNVFVGERPVERHMAPALRVYPGHLNFAIFCLGDGLADAYRFELEGTATAWDVRLTTAGAKDLWLKPGQGDELRTERWHPFDGSTTVGVSIVPPASADRGTLDIHVTQRSSGMEAVVEFDLDPRAQGPGCYTV